MAAPPLPIGEEPPRKPEHSLPPYGETTLEKPKNRNQSREDVAERDLKGTVFGPGARTLLIALFLLTIAVPPVIQLTAELRAGKGLPSFDFIKTLPKWSKIHAARRPADFWNLTPQADDIKNFEKGMEKDSVIGRWLLPHVQNVLTGVLGAGNEQAYPGRPGWLFYRPDVEYVTGPPFLDPSLLAKRDRAAGVVADPLPAILDFRDQLNARGIELVVFPVPVKPVIDGKMLSEDASEPTIRLKTARAGIDPSPPPDPGKPVALEPDVDFIAYAKELASPHPAPVTSQNASFAEFKNRLDKAGVRVFDPTELLLLRKGRSGWNYHPLYLETDTHWRPEAMELVAYFLSKSINPASAPAANYTVTSRQVTALGDIALMLKLPADQTIYRPQTVTIQEVSVGNAPWRASKDADTLLLGDSFSNIFSLAGMGWGESAGFAEHLSRDLGKPIDAILRNSDGAFATREILSKELARGHDRLAGKKLVVWEFAARELAIGNWKLLPMKLGQPGQSHFFNPKAGEAYTVTGVVDTISPMPLPGSVPYKDHILTVHLTDLQLEGGATGGSLQALVYLWSMRDNAWTPAARLRAGDPVKVRLRAWSDVSADYEKINRSDLDDPALQLEEPLWGELVP